MKLFRPIALGSRLRGIKYSLSNSLFWGIICDTLAPIEHKLSPRPEEEET
jgi:hypothetical protein